MLQVSILEAICRKHPELSRDFDDLQVEDAIFHLDPIRAVPESMIPSPAWEERETDLFPAIMAELCNHGIDPNGNVIKRDEWLYEDVYWASEQEHEPYHWKERGTTSSPHWRMPSEPLWTDAS